MESFFSATKGYNLDMNTKLIILRGPSGSGKSTIASRLIGESARKIATIERDMFKVNILHNQPGSRELSALMCRDAIVSALSGGFDVIADGIFNISSYKEIFDSIIAAHGGEVYMYYFDISLEETVRRHQTRIKKDEFGETEMQKWYSTASPAGYEFEIRVGEDLSEDEIVQKILLETGI